MRFHRVNLIRGKPEAGAVYHSSHPNAARPGAPIFEQYYGGALTFRVRDKEFDSLEIAKAEVRKLYNSGE